MQFGGIEVGSTMAALNVSLENASEARVDAWIDFDRDGHWSAAEKIVDNVLISNPLQTLNYLLPEDLTEGSSFARVRLSSAGGLGPTGPADDGEVEDYLVQFASSPRVAVVTINDGQAQRSSVDRVALAFDRRVDVSELDGDPFQFVNLETNQVVADIPTISVTEGRTVVEFVFAPGTSVSASGDLLDGRYQLTIDPTSVSYFGVGLDGDGDGRSGGIFTFGESATDGFFRKYGDIDGSDLVDLSDFAAFRSSFGRASTDENYLAGFDSNDDDIIDLADFAAFRSSFGT